MSASNFKVVVAVDGGPDEPEVLAQALDQASRYERPEMHILRVVETSTLHATPAAGEVEAAEASVRALVLEEIEAFGVGPAEWRVYLHVRVGRPAEEIENLVAEVEPRLIVVGHGATLAKRAHLGPVAERVLRVAPVPVLVARTPDYGIKDEQPEQCPECVAVRAESRGEQWFCSEHHGGFLGIATLLMPVSTHGERGGPMW